MSQHAISRVDELADDEIVEQVIAGDEFASDDAFKVLIERHGPMVLGVCRHVLGHDADAEDAFQATFLTLSRKIATIRNRTILGAWLHEVAYRTAVKTRVGNNRRRSLERQSKSMYPSGFVPDSQHHDAAWNELRPVLHDEVRRLPQKYRIPVIMSYLEGRTNEEVAELLRWPVGTVKGRLSRARALLRSRLIRRGFALSAAFLLIKLGDGAAIADVVSPELVMRTMLRVKRGNGAAALSASQPELRDQSSAEIVSRQPVEPINPARKNRRFLHPPKIVLIVTLATLAAIGYAAAMAGVGDRWFGLHPIAAPISLPGVAAPCH